MQMMSTAPPISLMYLCPPSRRPPARTMVSEKAITHQSMSLNLVFVNSPRMMALKTRRIAIARWKSKSRVRKANLWAGEMKHAMKISAHAAYFFGTMNDQHAAMKNSAPPRGCTMFVPSWSANDWNVLTGSLSGIGASAPEGRDGPPIIRRDEPLVHSLFSASPDRCHGNLFDSCLIG